MEKRSTFYDRGMRHLADERKKRPSEDYGSRAEGEQEGKRPKHKRKKPDSLAPQETNVGMLIYYAPKACAGESRLSVQAAAYHFKLVSKRN